jgi:hypothetical protein
LKLCFFHRNLELGQTEKLALLAMHFQALTR